MPENPKVQSIPDGGEALKVFQLTQESITDKSSKAYGIAISRYIASTTSFNLGGYYFTRNARFIKNRNYANGRIDIQAMFQDRFQFNGKQNYIALNWNALQIVNRICSGLVGRWMNRNEKIQVKAIDNLSQTNKEDEYAQLEFIIENREKLEELQKQSGVQIIPQTEIPEDKEALNIWRAEMQRLPEEILTEMGCNDVLSSNGCFDVLKEKWLADSAETFFVGSYVWMDNEGVIHVRDVKPENAIYSWTEQNDLRNTSWRGEAPTLKISEIRREWGKEFNPDNPLALDEKQLWEIAQKCKEYQFQTNIGWNDMWYSTFLRPYDEWNVRSIQFELKTVDNEAYTVTKSKSTDTTYVDKGIPKTKSGKDRDKPLDNQNIIGDSNWNIYRGVYLQDCDLLLQWGLKDNMIRPQDPKEIGNAEFSYSFVMPQNYMMRNLAIPEKIEAAVDGMILACLKVQQDVSMAIPPGWTIDETAWQGVDYGLGNDGNNAVDKSKLFFQTGKVFFKGLDAEGNRVPVPVQEIANTGFFNHIEAFIKTYQFWYQSLKDELGEDPNLISAALQPRVTAENVEASQEGSAFATDQYYRAYTELIKMTSRKVTCLLKDSVTYGSEAYRHILNEKDVDNRIFSTEIRFLPTEIDVQKFEAMVMKAMDTTPELSLFIDPMKLTRVAREDVKLAEKLFRQGQKKMLLWKQQMQQDNQQATIQGQIQSAQAAEQAKQQTVQLELQMKQAISDMESKNRMKEITLQGAFNVMTKGIDVQPEWKPVVSEMIKNLEIPLFAENVQNSAQLQQGIDQAKQMQAEQQGLPADQNNQQSQPQQNQPQQNQQSQQPVAA